ncbi:putative late blight resistance protein homolog R1B-12 isoform X2 [Ipomoea triloba]|nr:putative late blight resistance protein homolog R1B-12 isoform X2 [Ipomoea triloba]
MEIRDFALDAEDRIETQLSNFLLAKDTQDLFQQKASQQLHQILIEAAENAADLLRISNNISTEEAAADDETQQQPPPVPEPSSNVMVGRRSDHMLIMDKLIGGFDELQVISIVGMAGIGKTTLAASAYRDPSIASHFDVRGWITMSREYNKNQPLYNILWTLGQATDGIKKESIIPDDLAVENIYNFLTGKRYLIVLDNFWNNQAWYDIQEYLPDDRNRSRVVLTTTHFSWEYAYSNTYKHKMSLLNPEESWELFCNKLFLEQRMSPKFEKIKSQVVDKCEGLPHSIVVVSERLSRCSNIQQEWKKVKKELELLGVLDSRALTFTYNQLPQNLKLCFLYFGVFPKRHAISVKQLIRLWIAEGFLNALEHKGLEDQAYEYLCEFTNRSLIIIDTWNSERKIKTCRMHSALHSFCVREAQKEGILCTVNAQKHPHGSFDMFANSCRWLSFYKHSFDYYVLFKTNTPRSIFFFQEDVEIFVPFKYLRVLAFAPSSFLQRVPTHFQELLFLRYISVKEWFDGLDYIVSINRNLQTLVVSNGNGFKVGSTMFHLPSTIWESPQLQHLELDNSYAIDPPRVDKNNILTLSWLCPTHCTMEVDSWFPKIKNFKMFVLCSKPFILGTLQYLKQLERLTISVSFGCVVTLGKPSMFPSQLKKLKLNGTNLSESDLMAIGMLPQLEVLKLKNVFRDQEVWQVAERAFCRLKFLHIEDKKLKRFLIDDKLFKVWRVVDSFPHLEHLVLRCCYCLERIPQFMKNIATLKLIELEQCGPSVVTSAKYIQDTKGNFFGNAILEIKIQGT